MIKQFFQHSAIYTVSSLLTRGMSFILLPLYTRCLSSKDYGIFDYLTVFGGLIAVTVTFEITQGLARFMPENREDEKARRAYASTSLWFTLFAYVLFLIICIGLRYPLSQWLLGSTQYTTIFIAALFSFLVNGLVYLIQNQLRWELRPQAVNILSIINALLIAGSGAVLILIFHMGIMGIFASQILAGSYVIILGLFLTKNSYGLHIDFNKLKQMLRFSLPLVPSSIGVIISLYIDRFAIREFLSIDDVGIYGLGARVASIASLLMLGFQGALTPLIYAHYQAPETPQKLAKIFNLFVACALLFFLGLSSCSKFIVELIAPMSYANAVEVIPYLTLSLLFSNMYIFAPGLALAKRTGTTAGINIGVALLNTLLNILFIPIFGITGSAAATLLATFTGFCLYMYFSQKTYYVPHQWLNLCLATILIIIFGIAANAITINFYLSLGCHILVAVVVFACLFKVNKRNNPELLNA
jgi:O-antigen/teichoic acid export membrane protein